MKRLAIFWLALWAVSPPPDVHAFCGFYVSKVDTKLFNKASQVVLVREGDRTVLTMVNDFRGEPREFAMVVPVPTAIQRSQIHVGNKAVIDHLEAFSAPRLVEYYDEDPCRRVFKELSRMAVNSVASPPPGSAADRAKALGVTIEATYTVGEYDILILSARQSQGLETWLRESGYRIPSGASAVLGSYLRQNMKFFVAKVNLTEQARLGYSVLRPLQIAYESPKFMLPIRLGMVNADGAQELFIYTLTRQGRVETTNYRTVKLPSNLDLPLFVRDQEEFGRFYKAMFSRQVDQLHMQTVFTEYAWDMSWCDPCAAEPLSRDELRQLGVFWLDSIDGPERQIQPQSWPPSGAQNAFLTRLHVRYDKEHFPEDLVFQETADRTNFQGRYILRHPWNGSPDCPAWEDYRKGLAQRQEQEARNLAMLTGWDLQAVRRRMNLPSQATLMPTKSWWEKLWGN